MRNWLQVNPSHFTPNGELKDESKGMLLLLIIACFGTGILTVAFILMALFATKGNAILIAFGSVFFATSSVFAWIILSVYHASQCLPCHKTTFKPEGGNDRG